MSSDLFHLRRIKGLTLNQKKLDRVIRELTNLTAKWEDRGSIDSPDLVGDLRQRIQEGVAQNRKFNDYTAVKRRESLLLTLYLSDLADVTVREWLPAFDKKVAISILGSDPGTVKKHLRRMATQLYFTHYDEERLPCLKWFAAFLKNSWVAAGETALDHITKTWSENAETLFGNDAPDDVAKKWQGKESVEELADRFYIHEETLFRGRLFEALIFRQLRETSHQVISNDLNLLVTTAKDRILKNGYPLGSEAVKILITRSKDESNSRIPNSWREQIVTFACDPRIPSPSEKAKWWGWATPSDRDIAIRALSELTLHEFISLLKDSLWGTDKEHQFPERERFLLKLFEMGKVIEARMVVNHRLYRSMDRQTKTLLSPSWVSGPANQHTSFICLRCTNDVFLVEGTHDFALRGYVGRSAFPIRDFWDSGPKQYYDQDLRTRDHQIYQTHQGTWVSKLVVQLRGHNIEWRGLR